jgi:hypothetical protein
VHPLGQRRPIDRGFTWSVWATAYRLLGALPDTKSAILYSLSALTSYGHANLFPIPSATTEYARPTANNNQSNHQYLQESNLTPETTYAA